MTNALCRLVALAFMLTSCGGRSTSTDSDDSGRAGRGGSSSSSGGSNSGSGGGGSRNVTIDPDGVCSPPCSVALEEARAEEMPRFPDRTLLASLFYDVDARAFELRAGTRIPSVGESVVMMFTWEDNHYGYGEWVEGYSTFLSFEPDEVLYNQEEGIEFTAVVENPTIPLRVRVVFSFENQALLVYEATVVQ